MSEGASDRVAAAIGGTTEMLQQWRTDPLQVRDDLLRLAGGAIPVLCCFEKAGVTWCHRSLTAQWLSEGLGQPVPELGFEDLPQALHPLRPPATLLR
jgi:hypothetical protein